jgi:hypothetical protein
MSKLKDLAAIEGYKSVNDMLTQELNPFKSYPGTPGICINPDCNNTYNYEPDQDQGYCYNCESNTVQSCLILAGLI